MKKVIIIEDSPTFCNMLGKKLEAKGWKTILCYNYRDGLKAVKESSEWDVVISDMRLGNDNGIDLLEWMRSNGYQNPFIIMTSYDESMSAVRTMKLGAEDYIPKKLLLDVVYERLEEIIDKQKRLVELNNKIVYRKSEKFSPYIQNGRIVCQKRHGCYDIGRQWYWQRTYSGKDTSAKQKSRQAF